MADAAINIENVGKMYLISHHHQNHATIRDAMVNNFHRLRSRFSGAGANHVLHSKYQPFWACKDISFEVKQGERVGVIGRNGAGKSTLLKLLSRITGPTTGRIEIKGRVASLLEVGTGFHPELTGRENIFMNGAILGMTRAEIRRKFDEIVAFAENEQFLDTPVKRYSSGMYVRLAFAVAAHLEPEILIVDEVLAVGDLEFQKKCLGKMQQVSRQDGRTVLFVSHNMAAVQALCTKGVWLQRGQLQAAGSARDVVDAYMRRGGSGELNVASASNSNFTLNRVSAKSSDGALLATFKAADIDIAYTPHFDSVDIGCEVMIEDLAGTPILGLDSRDFFNRIPARNGKEVAIRFRIESLPLTSGPYRVRLRIKSDADNIFWEVPAAYELEVEETVVYGTRKIDRRVHGVTASPTEASWTVRTPVNAEPLAVG